MPPKLTKQQRQEIDEIMAPIDAAARLRGGGNLNLLEFIQAHVDHDISASVAATREVHTDLPAEALDLQVRCEHVDAVHSDFNWIDRGLARRFSLNSARELQDFVSMHVRFRLALDGDPKQGDAIYHYQNISEILRALAIRDIALAQTFAERGAFPIANKGPFHRIYNSVVALLRNDWQTFNSIRGSLIRKSSPKWVRAIGECLEGIGDKNAAQIAAAIEVILSSHSRTDVVSDLHKAICFEAHGFYTLAHFVDPQLVSNFDVSQRGPWDEELHDVAFASDNAYEFDYDLSFVSQEFHDVIVNLAIPPWWDG